MDMTKLIQLGRIYDTQQSCHSNSLPSLMSHVSLVSPSLQSSWSTVVFVHDIDVNGVADLQ